LHKLGKEGLDPADVPPFVQLTTRRLDVSADRSRLLSAGKRGASLFDGKEWQLLFDVEQLDCDGFMFGAVKVTTSGRTPI
jgi:hypothetical protein